MMRAILFLFSILILFSFQDKKENITRFNQSDLFAKTVEIVPHLVEFKDTIPNDTLFEYRDKNSLPLMYSRKILTGVCIDGKCRFVRINLFWHITGRYLGFELPGGEFLSKTEHHPFKPEEYNRLHFLLADPQSALSQYSLDGLVPKKDTTTNGVDAVSTATLTAVLDYIVKGAVYTTYTLWHIIYGPTQREIELLTTKNLSAPLVLRLLESESLTDQVWALNHITSKTEITEEIQNKFIEYISGDDVYLVERALAAIPDNLLSDAKIQLQLADIFNDTDFLKKRLILQRLKDAPEIHTDVVNRLTEQLESLSGTLVKSLMELLMQFDVEDKPVVAEVQPLLENENRYIANQAFKYLESLENPDRKTERKIEKFKKRNNF